MKKRSILLTCIVAVMALAMFVGCDNAPVLPSFVVSGNITQTGDFLIGQTFDPSKFSVTVTYDNGRIVAADDTVSVVLADGENSKVEAGTKVEAYIGKNYASENVTATANVRAYAIKSIAVSGPESYAAVKGLSIPASDLTVTATYLDSNNAEKTMVLVPGEYTVGSVNGVDIKKLNKVDTTVETSVTVTSVVGNVNNEYPVATEFGFTATYVETPEAPKYELETVDKIKYEGRLLNLSYDEIPTPAAEDVVVAYWDEAGNYFGFEDSEVTAADLEGEVVLEFVDANGNPLAYKDLLKTKVSALDVRMTYDGKVYTDKDADVAGTDVKVVVSPKEGFSVKAGVAIGEPDVNDFFFDLVTTEKVYIERLSANDVDVAYTNANTGDLEDIAYEASTIIKKDSDSVYLYATYMGAEGYTGKLDIEEADPVTVTGITAKLDTEVYKAPAYQNYTDFESSINVSWVDIASITVAYDNGTSATLEKADFNGSVSAKYTSDMRGTELKASDVAASGTIYIEVNYNGFVTYIPVELVAPVASSYILRWAPVYGTTSAPMLDSNIDWTIYGINAVGSFVYDGAYTVYIDGTKAAELPKTVGEKAVSTIHVNIDGHDTDDANIPAGIGYYVVDENKIAIDLAYKALIGDVIKTATTDYTIDSESYSTEGTPAEDATEPEIIDVDVETTGLRILPAGNTVDVTIQYTDNTGDVAKVVIPVEFNGVSYVDPGADGFAIAFGDKTYANGGKIAPGAYTIGNFTVAPSSYEAHKDAGTPDSSLVRITAATLVRGGEFNWLEGQQPLIEGDVVKFTISYVNGTTSAMTDPVEKWGTDTISITFTNAQ